MSLIDLLEARHHKHITRIVNAGYLYVMESNIRPPYLNLAAISLASGEDEENWDTILLLSFDLCVLLLCRL